MGLSKAIDPPKDLNESYLLVNQWIKPKAAGMGYASTVATMLENLDERRNNRDRRGRNRRGGKQQHQQQEDKQQGAKDSKRPEKPK
jgi:hypothetical protein